MFEQDFLFGQVGLLEENNVDPALRNGICFSLCIEWAERLCSGQVPTAEFLKSRIFTAASRHRAYLGHYSQYVNHATDTPEIQKNKILDVSWKYFQQQSRDYGRTAERVCAGLGSLLVQEKLAQKIREHRAVTINCVWPNNADAPRLQKAGKSAATGHAMICAWNGGTPLFFDPNVGQVIDRAQPSAEVAARQIIVDWVDRTTPEFTYDLYGVS